MVSDEIFLEMRINCELIICLNQDLQDFRINRILGWLVIKVIMLIL